MITDEWEVSWGGWVLGDLADVLRRASDLLGRTQDVSRVTLLPPETAEGLPSLTVKVPNPAGIFRLRSAVQEGEYLVDFIGRATERGWAAEVGGMLLTVGLEESS